MAKMQKKAPGLSDLPSPQDINIGIVVSEWNEDVTARLLDGCKKVLLDNAIPEENIHISYVPGSYELPLGARMMHNVKSLDAIICLGCLIKGETKHDEYIAQAVASGIMHLGLMQSIPVIFGVLTTHTIEQAMERAGGGHGNKGTEAAIAALKMIALKNDLSPKHRIGFGS